MDPLFRCFGCDALLDDQTRYCPHCGVRLDSGVAEADWPGAAEATAIYHRERPRLVGVAPQDTMLILGVAAVALGAVLAARNHVLAGGLVLLAAALVLVMFVEAVTRRPHSAIARWAKSRLAVVRAQVGFAAAAVTVVLRSRTARARLRRETAMLGKSRNRHLYALGDSVYREDAEAVESSRAALHALDQEISAKTAEVARLERRARLRIRAARVWRDLRSAQARG